MANERSTATTTVLSPAIMASPYTPYTTPSHNPSVTQTPNSEIPNNGAIGTPTPPGRGRPRGGLSGAGTGAKRGRKPRGGATAGTSPRIPQTTAGGTPTPSFPNQQYPHVHWALPSGSSTQASTSTATGNADGAGSTPHGNTTTNTSSNPEQQYQPQTALQQLQQLQRRLSFPGQTSNPVTPSNTTGYSLPSTIPTLDTTGLISFTGTNPPPVLPTGSAAPLPRPLPRPLGVDDDGDGEDELLPAMADDDYSAQLSWQSQSKDNLKWVVLSNHPSLGFLISVRLTVFAGS